MPKLKRDSRISLSRGMRAQAAIGFIILVIAAFGLTRPVIKGMVLSNLSSVAQTRSELRAYRWPEWRLQDELRRKHAVDLSTPVQGFHTALAADNGNATSHRRLGQILLSEGDYQGAKFHLESALRSRQEMPTAAMLGEAYAVLGDSKQAVSLWAAFHIELERLKTRQWWYQSINASQQADNLDFAVEMYRNVAMSKASAQ
jgi:tetratricopeptide (TPR) repeat protein